MIIHKMEQRTPEWYAVKLGKISASSISDVMAKGRGGGESKTRRNYMIRLIAERMSGLPQETYQNGAMLWGIETEPSARAEYEDREMTVVDQVGFVEVNEFLGCSPDGFALDGLLEIKCPNTTTHIDYMLAGVVPSEYMPQMQSQMWMCGVEWCDFVSYDPRLTEKPYWKIRVDRDDKKIHEISEAVDQFIEEMLELEQKIRGIK